MLADLIALMPEPTTVNLLLGGYGGMTAAIIAVYQRGERAYRDCRADRDRLWERVRELERRMR